MSCGEWDGSDPLTLDLDGDGLETTGINPTSPILFDHDADGIKTATGWVKSDDAFLVLDRNGNGTIDSGANSSATRPRWLPAAPPPTALPRSPRKTPTATASSTPPMPVGPASVSGAT